jgi:hypothetical protein
VAAGLPPRPNFMGLDEEVNSPPGGALTTGSCAP